MELLLDQSDTEDYLMMKRGMRCLLCKSWMKFARFINNERSSGCFIGQCLDILMIYLKR